MLWSVIALILTVTQKEKAFIICLLFGGTCQGRFGEFIADFFPEVGLCQHVTDWRMQDLSDWS